MLPELEIENLSHEELLEEAKKRRREPTKAETKLWKFLRSKKMYGFVFRRQSVCKNFIFDFYCRTLKLVIDIDYSVGNLLNAYYEDRDEKLRSLGYHVLRFKNDQILDGYKRVIRMIDDNVEKIWESKKTFHEDISISQNQVNYPLQTHPIPSPSPPEGKGTRAAGGMGSGIDKKPTHFDVSSETRSLLIEQARHMRSHPTQAEALIWCELRAKKLGGYKFRRQHPIGPFIVDFYCPSKKLVIEIDGPIHYKQIEYDTNREDQLMTLGYKVLRFTNQHVMNNLNDVLTDIYRVISQTND